MIGYSFTKTDFGDDGGRIEFATSDPEMLKTVEKIISIIIDSVRWRNQVVDETEVKTI